MRKYIFGMMSCLILTPIAVFAQVEDNSIIEALEEQELSVLDMDISLQEFASCSAFEETMQSYAEKYWKNSYYPMYRGGMVLEQAIMADDAVMETSESTSVSAKSSDYSQTNTQVAGVDEGDIVKTDGEYIYYYNQTNYQISILKHTKQSLLTSEKLELIKRINIPKRLYGVELFLSEDKLVILASGYSNIDYSERGYFFDKNAKSYSIIFDIEDPESASLDRLLVLDGTLSQSRRIGDDLYIISQNYLSYPYGGAKDDALEFSANTLIPSRIDIHYTQDESEQNVVIEDTVYPFKAGIEKVSGCDSIRYFFPDEESIEQMGFKPGYVLLTKVDISSSESEIESQLIAGNNTQMYMSEENLYLTDGIWQANNFRCAANMRCIMPFFWGGTQNTLIHKFALESGSVEYSDSALIPGSPLNQYSMDEYEGKFRIITSEWQDESSTGLYILDEDMEALSSLRGLAPGETFRSSRFMGDKLFLVTFEQVDPLFAIDLSDTSNPEVLGELKIPGYSTYLHPYDETHLIGLGYDTTLNQWGGVQNAGLKIDLYKIHYEAHCSDTNLKTAWKQKCEAGDYKGIIVEQLHSKVLGGKGSYSEALNNPRMFVWNAARNTLLLPMTLSERDESWNVIDHFSGMGLIQIDTDSGIELLSRVSHVDLELVEADRQKVCSEYENIKVQYLCDDEYGKNCTAVYEKEIPLYCQPESSAWQYFGSKSWEYSGDTILRGLYIGNRIFSLGDSKIQSYDWNGQLQESIIQK